MHVVRYQRIIQRRTPKTLPVVLALAVKPNAGLLSPVVLPGAAAAAAAETAAALDGPGGGPGGVSGSGISGSGAWRWCNRLGGAWLPTRVDVAIGADGSLSVAELVEGSPTPPPPAAAAAAEAAETTAAAAAGGGEGAAVADVAAAMAGDEAAAAAGGASAARCWSLCTSKADGATWIDTKHGLMDPSSSMGSTASPPASAAAAVGVLGAVVAKRYELVGLVSHVHDGDAADADGHLVAHVTFKAATLQGSGSSSSGGSSSSAGDGGGGATEAEGWVAFNDFAVSGCGSGAALGLHFQPWREPCILVYRQVSPPPQAGSGGNSGGGGGGGSEGSAISPTVFELPSLSLLPAQLRAPPTVSLPNRGGGGSSGKGGGHYLEAVLPGRGDPVAIDTEFVSIAEEDTVRCAR